jgi:glycosyltransferase involved in cell wall biosynthesis
MSIPPDAVVIGFVGRLIPDKGAREMIEAFAIVRREHPQAFLLVIGDFETGGALSQEEQRRIENDPRIKKTGFVWDPLPYYGLVDILAFPSHREGFPRAPLEAAALEIPAVGFAATGTVDAIVDGQTGFLAPLFDSAALAAAIGRYIADPLLRKEHGANGRRRVVEEFTNQRVWDAFYEEYARLLREKGIETPPPVSVQPADRDNVAV